MFLAGVWYARIVHKHRALTGLGAGLKTTPEGPKIVKTDDELKAAIEAARNQRESAEGVLRNVLYRGVNAMNRLCVDERDPLPNDEDLSAHCLRALAEHFGLLKRRNPAGKSLAP
jgi:hypothetical protein